MDLPEIEKWQQLMVEATSTCSPFPISSYLVKWLVGKALHSVPFDISRGLITMTS